MALRRAHRALLALPAVLLAACGVGDDTAGPTSTPVTSAVVTGAPVTTSPATAPTTAAPTTAPVTTAPATSAPAITDAPGETTSDEWYDFSAVGPIVEAFVAERGLGGAALVLVDREDGIVHEQYWGEFSAERVSLVASSSKMVAAGVLLRLQDDGLLDIDEPISGYVDWAAGNPDVTVAQLLSNSSGLVGLLPNPAYGPYLCQFLPAGDIEDCAAAIMATADDDADIVLPDTEFRYGGAQWQIAGAVAETVSGRSWAQLLDEIYAEPCGLPTIGFNNHFSQIGTAGFAYPEVFDGDPSVLAATDNPNIEAGMYTTPRDYAGLLLMHLRGGMCDGEQVLSQAALDTMHADRIADAYAGTTFTGGGYGLGWWVDRTTGRITDPGAYGSVPWLDLEQGDGGILVVEADTGTGDALLRLLDPVIEAAMESGD